MMRTHTFCWDHTHIRLLLKQDLREAGSVSVIRLLLKQDLKEAGSVSIMW